MNATSPHSDATRARILVIDDEAIIGALLVRVLRDYDVTVITDGSEALLALARSHWDGVLCDLSLPGVGGLEIWSAASSTIRRHFAFMTGGALTAEAQRVLDQTRAPVLDKPFTAHAVRDLMARVVLRGVAA